MPFENAEFSRSPSSWFPMKTAEMCEASNPVVPMSFFVHSRASQSASLSSGLSAGQVEALAQALGQAATALQNLASALQAQNGAAPSVKGQAIPHPCPPSLNDTALQRQEASRQWGELVKQFLFAKARLGLSDRYLRQLRVSLAPWVKGRARIAADSIETAHLEAWLEARGGSARTRRGYIGDLRTLFAWGVRRGYLARSPAEALELPRPGGERAIEIHTPDQVQLILNSAYQFDPDVGRHLAVRYFSGVRSAEAHRLREDAILLEQGFLEVSAVRSKTRSRRLIPIQPALKAWLAIGGELRPLSPNTIKRAVQSAGVVFPHNVTRHTFVTYHLAAFDSSAKTAMVAGHSEAILFRHYRALSTEATAKAFWALRPS